MCAKESCSIGQAKIITTMIIILMIVLAILLPEIGDLFLCLTTLVFESLFIFNCINLNS